MRFWNRLPAVAAFSLLACQMAVPWSVPHFVTGDGPSHLYEAIVAQDLLFHPHGSTYSPVYTIQKIPLPNWTTTVLLAAARTIAGTDRAEALFASLAILTGFLALSYVIRALAPDQSPWTPLTNFLLQTAFLWMGFYNFFLGMALLPFVFGFYVRHAGRLTPGRVCILGAGFAALFFTHLIAAAVAILAVTVAAIWMCLAVRGASGAQRKVSLVEPFLVLTAAAPTLALAITYLRLQSGTFLEAPVLHAPVGYLIRTFPGDTFVTGADWWAREPWAWSLALGYIVCGLIFPTRREWASVRGGLVITVLLCFIGYLFLPNAGLGGSKVNARFAWAVFLLGGVVAASASRLQAARVPLALALAVLLTGNIAGTAGTFAAWSLTAGEYLDTAGVIPAGSTMIRLRYPAPGTPDLYHLDALVAARGHDVDLTDYEAPSRVFPVVFRQPIAESGLPLWSFENSRADAVSVLAGIRRRLPEPVDFVLVYGDERSLRAQLTGMPDMLVYLNSSMRLAAVSKDGRLRIYRRI